MKILCRIFGHKYTESGGSLLIRSLEDKKCKRCGHEEKLINLVPKRVYDALIEMAKKSPMLILYWK